MPSSGLCKYLHSYTLTHTNEINTSLKKEIEFRHIPRGGILWIYLCISLRQWELSHFTQKLLWGKSELPKKRQQSLWMYSETKQGVKTSSDRRMHQVPPPLALLSHQCTYSWAQSSSFYRTLSPRGVWVSAHLFQELQNSLCHRSKTKAI